MKRFQLSLWVCLVVCFGFSTYAQDTKEIIILQTSDVHSRIEPINQKGDRNYDEGGFVYKAKPSEAKLVMIDPKIVELSVYNGIPHLLIPVVTDPKKAAGALAWAVQEMENRYTMFASKGVRDLKGYNEVIEKEDNFGKLPHIVIIVDELADLMMVAKGDVEDAICRLAQKARAAGMHLVIATQRPSVDVVTGLIKANIPSRIAFAVSSQVDSRTILDQVGAEKLLGKGDMLFFPTGAPKPVRIQGAFISEKVS